MFIMDTNDYITEAHNHIFNDKYYKHLGVPMYLNTTDEVTSSFEKKLLDGWLDNKQVEYLRPADNPRPCILNTNRWTNGLFQIKFPQVSR